MNFTTLNLLFPHIWQPRPLWNDPDRNNKVERNLQRRVCILKAVVTYVLKSKRFRNEVGGNF